MLSSFDDYPIHQTGAPLTQPATGDRNHYDRYFYNGYDRDGSLFFAVAMGLYPNRSVIDASFSVVCDGVQRSVHASGRAPAERASTAVGPIRIEVIEPFRTHRIVVDAGAGEVSADLTYRSRTVAIEEPRFTRFNGSRLVMDYTRLTQFGSWDGVVNVDGTDHRIEPDTFVGSRDRSWGIRSVGEPEGGAPGLSLPQFFWLWAPLNFDDRVTHFDVNETERGERWHQAGFVAPTIGPDDPVVDPGGHAVSAEPMRHVDWSIDWQPGTRRARAASLTFEPWNGEPSTIHLEPISTFHMYGIGYFHPEWSHGRWRGEDEVGTTRLRLDEADPTAAQHVHVQQLVRAHWEGREGIGVLEQLVIGEHEPSGITGIFDGHPG